MIYSINDVSFNQNSVDSISVEEGRKKFSEFVKLIKNLQIVNCGHELVSKECIINTQIARDYYVYNWLNDSNVNRDIQIYAKSVLKKINSIESTEGEFFFETHTNDSCMGAAFLVESEQEDSAICSYLSDEEWKKDILHGRYVFLSEECQISEKFIDVSNFSGVTNQELFENRKRQALFSEIASAKDLWNLRNILFPNLVFCESVSGQLEKNPSRFHSIAIAERLMILQQYFAEQHERYDPKELGHGARTESETVKSNKSLKNQRKNITPAGEEVFCFEHIGFSGQYNGRIHFYPDVVNKRAIIGYIGPHLETAQY